jgi:2-dehydro-3-deoxyphosphogalactonate aldolase
LKIVNVKTYIVGNPPPHYGGLNWVFCKVVTDEGIEGWGECPAPWLREHTYVQAIREYADRFLINQDPYNIEAIWEALYKTPGSYKASERNNYSHFFQHPGTFQGQVMGALEIACWDIVGKDLNQPIYRLLGGVKNRKLRAYTYIYEWQAGDPPEKAGPAAIRLVEKGFTLFKFDPIPGRSAYTSGHAPREISLKELRYTDSVLKCMRDAVGDECDIGMGTHGQLNTHSAIRFAKILEKYDCLWFEEPVPLENVDEIVRLSQHTSVPIATGERLSTKWDFRPLLEKQAVQILQIMVGQTGILESKKIAGMAEAYNAQIAPWMYCGPVNCAANIQLDVTSPNFLAQEVIDTMSGLHAKIITEPIRIEKGYIIPSTKPGLGIGCINEKILSKYPYHSSRM